VPAGTPLCDRVFSRTAGWPHGTRDWLRDLECRARDLHGTLIEHAASGPSTKVLTECLAELSGFLSDAGDGLLTRVLRRPPRQLELAGPELNGSPPDNAAKSPALQALQRSATALFERAENAIRVQQGVNALRSLVNTVRQEYGLRLPRSTEQQLMASHLSESELLELRRPSEVTRSENRLAHAKRALEQLRALLPEGVQESTPEPVGPDGMSLDELRAALSWRLRRRYALQHGASLGQGVRRLALAHVEAIDRTIDGLDGARRGSGTSGTSGDANLVLQHFAHEALRPGGIAQHHEDVPLWFELLHSAQAALRPGDATVNWPGCLGMHVEAEREEPFSANVYFVIPIDNEYVWVTNRDRTPRSPVRVWEGQFVSGGRLECHLFTRDGSVDAPLAALDIPPAFEGFDPLEAGWYETTLRAELVIVLQAQGGFFARIDRRGQVVRREPAWIRREPESGWARITYDAVPRTRIEPVDVGDLDGPTRGFRFLGTETRVVMTPLSRSPIGWLRYSDQGMDDSEDGLDNERAFFRELARTDLYMAPHHVGRARLAAGSREGVLYVPPYGARLGDYLPLTRWLTEQHESRIACLRAIARLLERVHALGYALCCCHLEAFAFAPVHYGRGQLPGVRALVTNAPLVRKFGERITDAGAAGDASMPLYERLRFQGLPPPVIGAEASATTDALAFALLVLELLAEQPLGGDALLSWGLMLDTATHRVPACFEHAEEQAVRQLLVAIHDKAQWEQLRGIIANLIGDVRRSTEHPARGFAHIPPATPPDRLRPSRTAMPDVASRPAESVASVRRAYAVEIEDGQLVVSRSLCPIAWLLPPQRGEGTAQVRLDEETSVDEFSLQKWSRFFHFTYAPPNRRYRTVRPAVVHWDEATGRGRLLERGIAREL